MDREYELHDPFWERKGPVNTSDLFCRRMSGDTASRFALEPLVWNSLLVPSSLVRSCESQVPRPRCW